MLLRCQNGETVKIYLKLVLKHVFFIPCIVHGKKEGREKGKNPIKAMSVFLY